jgi:hypothetical protein
MKEPERETRTDSWRYAAVAMMPVDIEMSRSAEKAQLGRVNCAYVKVVKVTVV